MSNVFTIAAAQLQPSFMKLGESLQIAEHAIQEAAKGGAKLVVFPETWLSGFPMWIFSNTGWRDPVYQQAYVHLLESAVSVGDPAVTRLCEAARANNINIVMGVNERDGSFSRESLYNSLLFISEEGELLGVHRKLKPTHAERILWGEGDGSSLRVYQTSAGRIGGSICWENWMPLERFTLHALGEQIHAATYPDIAEHNMIAARHYAFEGRCFVVATATVLRRSSIDPSLGLPLDHLAGPSRTSSDSDFILAGGSGIVGPDGKWIKEQTFYKEEIIYADIDLDDITRWKESLDTAGHYNRPDIFQLRVNRTRRPQVSFVDDDGSSPGQPSSTGLVIKDFQEPGRK